MELNEIKEILENHTKYLEHKRGGKRADFHGADLRGADFREADLREAVFEGADLRGADFSKANLSKANLRANLCGAIFWGADLSEANLFDVNLSGADLSKAILCGANLFGSNFSGALLYKTNLWGANLQAAKFYGTDFSKSDFYKANLYGTNLSNSVIRDAMFIEVDNMPYIPMACPDTGSFIAWKKAGGYIVKLLIPDDAKRSSANGRKCRANKAKVLEIQDIDGGKANISRVTSNFDAGFIYEVGQEVIVPNFEKNRFIECAPGIHFFVNRQEAKDYEW
jgi:hypothetical protein